MKPLFPIVVIESARIIFNKTVCFTIVLSMLVNLTAPAFAARNKNKKEEEQLFSELNQVLKAEYAKKASPAQNYAEICLSTGAKAACEKYLNEISALFSVTVEEVAQGKQIKEETFTPLSKKAYIKSFEENIHQEFKLTREDINQDYLKQSQMLEEKYKGISVNSVQYPNYIFAKSSLDNWQKENLQELEAWKENVLAKADTYYQNYLNDFEKNLQEYNQEREEALNEYLRSIASEVMAVYKKAPESSKLKLADIFVYLLSMESEQAKLFTSAQKSEIYRFFNKLVFPSNRQNPCRIHTRQRNNSELKEYNAWQKHLVRMEQETRGTLSARDQIAEQSRAFEQRVSADLRAPITELADKESCQAALSALTGLAYFKGRDMSSASMLMMENATEPMAAQVLLMGTKTLIETNRLDAFNSIIMYMIDKETESQNQDDLRLKEQIFYKGRFYKTPYIYSRYSQEDGGGDVWQDIAKMLSKEKTPLSKQIQQEIFDRAVNFSVGTGTISFNNNLPFVYGIILNNPEIIDTFVPSSAIAYSYGKYEYNGKQVYFQYEEDKLELYVKDKDKGVFYLSDSAVITDLNNNVSLPVGEVRKVVFAKFKANKKDKVKAYFNYFEKNHPNLAPSAVYAEAFYRADFIDLTIEEKLAMDKALEKEYPHLKKLSATHKYQIERNRLRADRLSSSLVIIDIALTLWFAGDIYKGIKWSVKTLKALRQLFTAGKAIKGLSNAKRISFLKTFAKNNPRAVKLNRNLNKIKTMPQRVVNNFPKYKANFDKFMMQTADYMAVPSGMRGQRVAVQNYNNYLFAKGSVNKRVIRPVQVAKASGPINILKKDGKTPISYDKIKFNKEGYFEVGEDFFKTFKASMEPEDIVKYSRLLETTIADLEKTVNLNKDRIAFLAKKLKSESLSAAELTEYEKYEEIQKLLASLKKQRYVLLRPTNVQRSFIEKWRSHKSSYEIIPLYDEKGSKIYQLSLDLSLNEARKVYKGIETGDKLILKGSSLYLGSKLLNAKLGVSKEVITLLAKSGRKVEDFSFLTLTKTSSKMFPFIFNNGLGFATASSSLNMSLNQSPFNNPNDPNYISQPIIFGISVAFPYAFSLLSPMAAPFVKRYGAVNVQVAALVIACAGMSYAAFSGYSGFATKKRDENGKLIRDENGKTVPTDKAPSYRPLVVASFSAGISSALKKASLNTAIHTYQTSQATMASSMLAKNVGSLFMTLIPWAMESKLFFGKDNIDFSISYPFLAGLSLISITCIKGFLPSSIAKVEGYKIMPHKATSADKWYKFWNWKSPTVRDLGDAGKEIFKPFVLFGSSKVMPYYLSYLAFGATESFVLFKTYNTFVRDAVYRQMSNTKSSKNDNKLIASLIIALPSSLVRAFWKRKSGFSTGIFNSIVLTTAGTLGLMLPGENRSDAWNLGVGALSGILLGVGTANMYQYLQKRMIAGISNISEKGVLPLARRFDGISGLRTTAISFYSGAYIGSFIPFGYSFMSEREVKKGASDFYANQSVLPLALRVYGWGIVPLALTQTSRAMFGRVSPYSIFFSSTLGFFAIRDLYRNYQRKNPGLMPVRYTPFDFDRNLYINPFNTDLSKKYIALPEVEEDEE